MPGRPAFMTPQSRQKPSVLVIDSAADNLVFGPLTLTQRGQTANFVVSFDENVGASGPTLADAVLASCEADYNALQTLFGNLSLKSLPFAAVKQVAVPLHLSVTR